MTYREIVSGIYNVGVVDALEREFHVHEIGRGTSYNSFLIKDTKITLIDTVKENFAHQFIDNIKACLHGKQGDTGDDEILKQIQIIYVLHTEPDHNGSLRTLHSLCPDAEIVCGKMVKQNLLRWYPESKDWKIHVVANNEKISTGEYSLQLIETPLLHWNDSTFAYMAERKLLFTSDAFGQHIGNNLNTDSDLGEDDLLVQMKVYYAQVFSQVVNPTLKMVKDIEKASTGKATETTAGCEWKSGFDSSGIDGILPAHGVCLLKKSTIERSVRLYRRWAEQVPCRKVVILYESIYDTVGKIARTMRASIERCAAEEAMKIASSSATPSGTAAPAPVVVEFMCARRNTVLDIVGEILDAPVVLIGSATFNNAILPNLMKMLHTIRSYKWKEKKVVLFGAYGWTQLAMKELEKIVVEEMKWKPLCPLISCINEMDAATEEKAKEAGVLAFKAAMEIGLPGGCLALE
ncbi:A-type flavoprotein [Monocercomonoides exilis]|uniref:A-type flavoprotein n=1 Tax=Monocercomonoides exilis TaxID=2049356 RepID=UPI00355A83F1|nr:A-type flavoprotein [Monocercomonoides exilis]|eukprot:MONOS_13380.1-p1 / transcript=MONOS_13380.1 / gene=MONOS_13380 / organism=Monocercomonoides_exilis_PA203 / gene_product=A-type flavoprotein / transcript_product=A-type flavoprotein / location=Mono_scaffold00819:4912-6347(+) / protein_length=463 / sequence_SO=supercontig / SO=protein_coding / is_pseudo=false